MKKFKSIVTLVLIIASIFSFSLNVFSAGYSLTATVNSQTRQVTLNGVADGGEQKISVYVMSAGSTPADITPQNLATIVYAVDELTTAEDGAVDFSIKLPAYIQSGYYNIILGEGADDIELAQRTVPFYYATVGEVNSALLAASTATTANIGLALKQNMTDTGVLSVPAELYNAYASAEAATGEAFVAVRDEAGVTSITTIEQFVGLFEKAVGIGTLNTTTDIGAALIRYDECLSIDLGDEYKPEDFEYETEEDEYKAKTDKEEIHKAFMNVRQQLKPLDIEDINKCYKVSVAIGMVNNATRESLADVLVAYNNILNLDLSGDFVTADKLELGKALAHKSFKSVAEIQTAFANFFTPVNQNQGNNNNRPVTGGGSSGGGGGGGSFGGGVKTNVSYLGDVEEKKEEVTKPVETTVSFSDINEVGSWAHESIYNLAKLGVINGVGDDRFAPNANVTREQFVKMLVLAFDLKADSSDVVYNDVAKADWCYPYIATADSLGIVKGFNNSFGVGENITRQDMAVMAYRALTAAGVELNGNLALSFEDGKDIADYAKVSVSALYSAEIINGVGGNMFAPTDFTTRAQAAKVINMLLGLK